MALTNGPVRGLTRRGVLGTGAALATGLSAPRVLGQARPRVVIIGGGAGGASAARHIAQASGGAIAVTLIDPARRYYSCFLSNLYLGGLRSFESLGHDYGALAKEFGITVLQDLAVGVDRDRRAVTLGSGAVLSCDRLILSPGIDFRDGAVPGWDLSVQDVMPHAYRGGTQLQVLKAQIAAMPPGGTFCLIAPPNPYRCPPAPYERVSMVARYLSQNNPTAKILLVDPKEKYSKQALFEEGWQAHYPGMILRIGPDFGAETLEVRPDAMEVVIDGEVEAIDVCNVIPAQRAGTIAALAGVTVGDWAPVWPGSMRSRVDANIFVLGDASAQGEMPKSAFAANSQARVAANAVCADLIGAPVVPPNYTNMCWSVLAEGDSVRVGATYEPGEDKIVTADSFISQTGEDAATRAATYAEGLNWYDLITADMFGHSNGS